MQKCVLAVMKLQSFFLLLSPPIFFGVTACFALSTLYVWRIVRLLLADNDQFSHVYEPQ